MSGKQLETSAVKRSARSGDLCEDVHAIAVIIDHFLNAGDLPSDAAKAGFYLGALGGMITFRDIDVVRGFDGSFANLWCFWFLDDFGCNDRCSFGCYISNDIRRDSGNRLFNTWLVLQGCWPLLDGF
jgi:hypothetical protein